MVKRKKIVVADDETAILAVLAVTLEGANYHVLTAQDGAEALELCRRRQPDILITDYRMPHLSGLELSRALRGHRATGDIAVIMLTGFDYAISKREMASAGIAALIAKPFSPKEILRKVALLCGHSGSKAA